ncbi:uncharacterized protein LOC142582213 isoform X5 [Dermacentor variabilis]|uniref:uncharacterized protein LOC142582213 isoform X5 n=1 Tax=Dermacentor variabilis TaxID=34621 RepID=UPI003F5B68EE
MATQSKDSEQLVQHPALLARNAGELKERASSSSPTTLVLLLVVPIVLVFFADFAFAVAMKSSEAQAGQRAAVKTTDTSSNGESASGGSGPDATVKDKRKTPMNQKSTAKGLTAQKKHDLLSRKFATRRKTWSTGGTKAPAESADLSVPALRHWSKQKAKQKLCTKWPSAKKHF